MIGQETKAKLSDDCARRGSDFDCCIRGRRESTRSVINIANHDIGKVDGKDIVGIGITIELVDLKYAKVYNPTPATIMALYPISMEEDWYPTEHDTKRIWHCPSCPRLDAYVL